VKRLILVFLCVSLAACASSGRLSSVERLALYRAHAGAPQGDMPFQGSLNGWNELGDSALAVWTRPGQAFLLELTGPCPDLPYAQAIGLTSRVGRVSARLDKVLVRGPGPGPQMPCYIGSIRPLDVKALRASEQQLRHAQAEARQE
jgi:hypothetical protein